MGIDRQISAVLFSMVPSQFGKSCFYKKPIKKYRHFSGLLFLRDVLLKIRCSYCSGRVISQSIKTTLSQSIDTKIKQSINQSINQCVNLLSHCSIKINAFINEAMCDAWEQHRKQRTDTKIQKVDEEILKHPSTKS